jgi:TolA-binding protein
MWKFCLHSLFRKYGWQFIGRIAAPHPVKTTRAVLDASSLDLSGDMTAIFHKTHPRSLNDTKSIVGVGFCLKPINPLCPSGRANHDCLYLERLRPSEMSKIPPPCRRCAVGEIGIMALKMGAAFYIMTSARDILFDVFTPAIDEGRFSSGLFALCRYSLRPFAVGMLASGIQGWLFPFGKGDCRDYKTWLLADIGIKDEQTEIIESKQKMIMELLANTQKKPAYGDQFEKQGNIFYPLLKTKLLRKKEKRKMKMITSHIVVVLAVSLGIGISTASCSTVPAKESVQASRSPASVDMKEAEVEVEKHYVKAHPEIREFVLLTAKTFGQGGMWLNEDAFVALPANVREERIKYLAILLEESEYGRHLCAGLAEAGALKDKRLLPGLMKVAGYQKDNVNYDCRPKWMAVAALARQESDEAVPLLVSLVDHGNENTHNWARAALSRKTGQDFKQDKQAWAKWWQAQGNKQIDDQLLKPFAKLEQLAPPKNAGSKTKDNASTALQERVRKRFEQDRAVYSRDDLRKIEALYQVANKKWNSPEAKEALTELIEKYPKAARTGCALLYMGQMHSGEERENYLKRAISDFSDCFYGDGVQVGAYARFYLANYYQQIGKKDEASALFEEIRKDYPDSVNHKGRLLSDLIPE